VGYEDWKPRHRTEPVPAGRRRFTRPVMAVMTGMVMLGAGTTLGVPDAPAGAGSVHDAEVRDAEVRDAEVRDAEVRDAASGGDAPVSGDRLGPPDAAVPSSTPAAPAPPSATSTRPVSVARTHGPGPATVATTPPAPPPAAAPAAPAAPQPIEISYQSFGDTSGLVLGGAATRAGPVLRLTDTTGYDRGSAWSRTQVDPTRSFQATFVLRIQPNGADGIAFVLQSEGPGALGAGGGALGYGDLAGTDVRVRPSVAVEFDTFDNAWDPSTGYNHIAVIAGGAVNGRQVYGIPGFTMRTCGAFTVWLDYDASAHRLRVYASRGGTRPATPVVAAIVDIGAVLGARPGYAGFTASTGQLRAAQDVLSWYLLE
jgi:Legume lectin domain